MNKFSCTPSEYTFYRPQYPEGLFEYLKLLSGDKIILECGAGSGQATKGLSSHFGHVVATDLSFELITEAERLPNITYIQSRAEQLPIRSHSVSLICIAQALHWFSLDEFYHEAKRVLTPDGKIAAWSYNQSVIDSAVDEVINEIYVKISDPKSASAARKYVYEHYQTIPFPFYRIPTPNFTMQVHWSLQQLLGYMSTWPGIIEYQKKHNIDIISKMKNKFLSAWGYPENKKTIIWSIHLLVGQINA